MGAVLCNQRHLLILSFLRSAILRLGCPATSCKETNLRGKESPQVITVSTSDRHTIQHGTDVTLLPCKQVRYTFSPQYYLCPLYTCYNH